jgi:hypothetical protein
LSAQVVFSPGQVDPEAEQIPYFLHIEGNLDFLAVADLIDKYAAGNFADPFEREVIQYEDESEAAE